MYLKASFHLRSYFSNFCSYFSNFVSQKHSITGFDISDSYPPVLPSFHTTNEQRTCLALLETVLYRRMSRLRGTYQRDDCEWAASPLSCTGGRLHGRRNRDLQQQQPIMRGEHPDMMGRAY